APAKMDTPARMRPPRPRRDRLGLVVEASCGLLLAGLGRSLRRSSFVEPADELGCQVLEDAGIEGIHLVLAATLDPDQVGELEDGQMMGQRGWAQADGRGELAGRSLAA